MLTPALLVQSVKGCVMAPPTVLQTPRVGLMDSGDPSKALATPVRLQPRYVRHSYDQYVLTCAMALSTVAVTTTC